MGLYVFCFGLFMAIGGCVTLYRWRKGAIELSLLLLIASSQSAVAAPFIESASPINSLAALGASEGTLTQTQKDLEETLKLDPTGDHYKGIEYAKQFDQNQANRDQAAQKNQPTDQEIIEAIKSQLSDDVAIAVSNGSVRMSGNVSNRAAAQKLVELAKETAGVHEVAFDLGLTD